jgi:hypothetical protein
MRKLLMILREGFHLVRRNKVWFLMPILVGLALLAFLVYTLGPVAMVTFLYAGI